MRSKEFINESAASELAKKMHGLSDFKYGTIGSLMKTISIKHDISQDKLHHVFVDKYGDTPDHWIKDKYSHVAAKKLAKKLPGLKKHDSNTIDQLIKQVSHAHKITGQELHDAFEKQYKYKPHKHAEQKSRKLKESEENNTDYGAQPIVQKFIKWAAERLSLQSTPTFEFSYDTDEAQAGHHTGRHVDGDNSCWVYVANRNMVDVFRTIFHELVHVRQGELNMIKPGDSYPGSPIEMMADVLAGKYIKIFGKEHPEIFQ